MSTKTPIKLEIGRFVNAGLQIDPEVYESKRKATLADVGRFRRQGAADFLAGIRILDAACDTQLDGWLRSRFGLTCNDLASGEPEALVPLDSALSLDVESVVTACWSPKDSARIGFKQTPDEGLFLPAGLSDGLEKSPNRHFNPVHPNSSQTRRVGMLPLRLTGFIPGKDTRPEQMPYIPLGPVVARIVEGR